MSRILALESTSRCGSLALFEGKKLVKEVFPPSRSAQSFAPGIQDILDSIGWKSTDIEFLAVSQGPGSFTGLRVGIATAKMFAYAVEAKIIAVDTMLSIAANSCGADSFSGEKQVRISVGIDAQRGEVVAQNFTIFPQDPGKPPEMENPSRILPLEQWWAFGENAFFTGPILEKIEKRIPPEIRTLDPSLWNPRASSIGAIALSRIEAGEFDDLFALSPKYFRSSAAEERLENAKP